MIPVSKPGDLTKAVLVNPAKKVSGYSGVEDTRVARQNVDMETRGHGKRTTRTIN
jgi:hypothetical protein